MFLNTDIPRTFRVSPSALTTDRDDITYEFNCVLVLTDKG